VQVYLQNIILKILKILSASLFSKHHIENKLVLIFLIAYFGLF